MTEGQGEEVTGRGHQVQVQAQCVGEGREGLGWPESVPRVQGGRAEPWLASAACLGFGG